MSKFHDIQETVEVAGLRLFDVFDRFGDPTEPVWTGLASSAIHALDLYIWKRVDPNYSSYSGLLEGMLEEDRDDDLAVYEHEGALWAVLENTEIYAKPRTAPYGAAAPAGVTAPAAPAAPVRAAYGAPAVRGTVTPAAPAAPRFELRSDYLYADTPVHVVWDKELEFAVQTYPWEQVDVATRAVQEWNARDETTREEVNCMESKPTVYLMIAGGNGYSAITRAKRKSDGFFEIIETVEDTSGNPLTPGSVPNWESAGICDHRGGGGAEGFKFLDIALTAAESNASSLGLELEHVSL